MNFPQSEETDAMTICYMPAETLVIRAMLKRDAARVLGIYQEGIDTGQATFQERAPAWPVWDRTHLSTCRLVAERAGGIVAFAALSPVSSRDVYRGLAEVSLYVAAAARGLGLGRQLLQRLIEESEQHGIWTLQAGVFPENGASATLHQSLGFRLIGARERVGRMTHGPMAGRWRDVLLLERRSPVAGQT
ncbi:MAG: GNAT family N-acetyltransferase [Methyloligellaceae bacterium]